MKYDTLIRNGRVVTAEQGEFAAEIAIAGGKIAAILRPGEPAEAGQVIDATGRVVMPGAIDPHLHLARLKPPEHDYHTETASAAIGGVTTIVPYAVTQGSYDELFQQTLPAAESAAHVDFTWHYFIANDEHIANIPHYIRDHGISTFKFYMPARGVEETILGRANLDDGLLYDLFSEVAKHDHGVVCIHCENVEVIWRLRKRIMEAGRTDLAAFADSRPPFVEAEAVQRATFFAHVTGCPVHVVHLCSGAGLNEIRHAKERYPNDQITVETCPAYLVVDKFSPLGNLARVVPAIQGPEDNEALWAGLADGSIDCMATDHSMGLREWKQGTVWQARNNFADVAVMLPIVLSEGHHKRGIPLRRVVELCSYNTARICNLYPRKGTIQVGSDADLILVDLDWERVVKNEELYTWADFCIYEGMHVRGWPRLTLVRGTVVQRDGKLVGDKGHGQFLRRPVGSRAEAVAVPSR